MNKIEELKNQSQQNRERKGATCIIAHNISSPSSEFLSHNLGYSADGSPKELKQGDKK